MTTQPDFDLQTAHKYFSAHCFNRAWDYIDKPMRTTDEDNTMLQLSLSSLWHWTQREDSTITNLAIGYWQVSRVFALLKQADNAREYGKLCLETASKEGVLPYYSGTAYEALARAEMVAGNRSAMQEYLAQAQRVADSLTDKEEREMLLKDLATIL
jgi:hypothetical protein